MQSDYRIKLIKHYTTFLVLKFHLKLTILITKSDDYQSLQSPVAKWRSLYWINVIKSGCRFGSSECLLL